MKINHHLVHYLIGFTALALGTYAIAQPPVSVVSSTGFGASAYGTPVSRTSRFEWPSLGVGKTIALGDALTKLHPAGKVTLYCSSATCQSLRADIDDALQIAGWYSDFEDRPVDSEADKGICVGPPGEDAARFAHALKEATGTEVTTCPIDGIVGLGVIIGKSDGR